MPEADQSETNSPAASGPEVTRNDEQGRYEIREGEDLLGFAEFKPIGGGAVLLPHTEVFEGREGEGLGSRLARFALDDIRAQGKQVVPMCPFIARYIADHREYVELIHPQQRGVFGL